jgi:hypothetical protein
MFASADLPSACRIVSSATIATATCLALYALVHSASVTKKPRSNTPAPASAEKARLPPAEDLPYPSDALPGARLVDSPYGTVNVFEWGPEAGEKVLLLHGIGTPCIALGDMAEELARNGYRVMLFGESASSLDRSVSPPLALLFSLDAGCGSTDGRTQQAVLFCFVLPCPRAAV